MALVVQARWVKDAGPWRTSTIEFGNIPESDIYPRHDRLLCHSWPIRGADWKKVAIELPECTRGYPRECCKVYLISGTSHRILAVITYSKNSRTVGNGSIGPDGAVYYAGKQQGLITFSVGWSQRGSEQREKKNGNTARISVAEERSYHELKSQRMKKEFEPRQESLSRHAQTNPRDTSRNTGSIRPTQEPSRVPREQG